jgi:hypothetical protein
MAYCFDTSIMANWLINVLYDCMTKLKRCIIYKWQQKICQTIRRFAELFNLKSCYWILQSNRTGNKLFQSQPLFTNFSNYVIDKSLHRRRCLLLLHTSSCSTIVKFKSIKNWIDAFLKKLKSWHMLLWCNQEVRQRTSLFYALFQSSHLTLLF